MRDMNEMGIPYEFGDSRVAEDDDCGPWTERCCVQCSVVGEKEIRDTTCATRPHLWTWKTCQLRLFIKKMKWTLSFRYKKGLLHVGLRFRRKQIHKRLKQCSTLWLTVMREPESGMGFAWFHGVMRNGGKNDRCNDSVFLVPRRGLVSVLMKAAT